MENKDILDFKQYQRNPAKTTLFRPFLMVIRKGEKYNRK